MKRTLIVFLVIALCTVFAMASILYAGKKEAAPKKEEAAPAAKKVLRLWSWNNEGDYPKVFELLIERFKQTHPDVEIKIQWVPYTEYNEKLKATIAAGDYPEIVEIHPGSPMYSLYKAGELRPLTQELKTGFPNFFESALADLTFDGNVYSIPLDVNNLTVFYNKNIFKKLNLTIPETIDDLIAICKVLKNNGYLGIALGAKDGWPAGDLYFQMVAYTDGSHTLLRKADFGQISWNRPEFIDAALQIIRMNENGVFPPGTASLDYFTGAVQLFTQQKAAMFYPAGSWIVGGFDTQFPEDVEYGLFPFPKISKVQNSYSTGGVATNWGILKNAKNQDLILDFYRMATDQTSAKILVDHFMIPPYKVEIKAEREILADMIKAQAIAQTRFVFTPELHSQVMSGVQGLLTGELSAADFVAALDRVAATLKR
ncbi:MAG: ABC transporter substrate-binding protein [Spirochaetota bacterium]|uniref:ABC transporter substrate-binding protein n=1 Tax=Candidatus Jordarchaeum sp. TaxID=2823881 RepID=UPI00404A11A4